MSAPLLVATDISRTFASSRRRVVALDRASISLARGETLGLVGPSGSGKSTLARILLRLVEPDAGRIDFGGVDLLALRGEALRDVRKRIQMVFQDPLAAFNPRATVAGALADPLRIHGLADARERPAAIARLLERVGLDAGLASRAIHEISGGQRQRVAIARALATKPDLIVLDEAVSALDVSVRGKILDLLVNLQRERRHRLCLRVARPCRCPRRRAPHCDHGCRKNRGERPYPQRRCRSAIGDGQSACRRRSAPRSSDVGRIMPEQRWSTLLDIPAYPADGYARLADRICKMLRTKGDVLLVQGEAIIALEAVATSIASPAIRALNVVTSPYGKWFGDWLRRGGADVTDVTAPPAQPVAVEAFAAALDARPEINLVALVHAESASGILNPLPEIARLARARGAMVMLDAVASFGGHDLDIDGLGVDIAVVGAQKAFGGSSGLAAVSVSKRAWTFIDRQDAPVFSTLSLLDLKRNWLDKGRGLLPGMPSALEFFALEAALDRVDTEGLDATVARHALAAAATRDGLRALGVAPWVEDIRASNLVTTARLPNGIDIAAVLTHPASLEAGLSAGVGDVAGG